MVVLGGGLVVTTAIALTSWLIELDTRITDKFDGKKWAIPAKVYAQPVELYEGMTLRPDTLETQLRSQGYQAVDVLSTPGTFVRKGSVIDVYARGFVFPDGPQDAVPVRVRFTGNRISGLDSLDTSQQSQGLSLVRLDPQLMGGIYPQTFEDRILIQMDEAPVTLVQALMAVEDRDFYNHWGVSPKSILRAMVVNMQAGGIVQGGSTLTQQLIKNFYLNNERTLTRKLEEAFMSLLLEWHYSKDEILETYLNEVYLGQQGQRSVHGFSLASHFYFARPLTELDIGKQALLVAMVKGPSYYNPRRYPERAKIRRDLVLDEMVEHGIITTEAAEDAKTKPLGVVPTERLYANAFPSYIDLVKRQLQQDYRNEDLTSEGLRIFTNMNPIVQQQAQNSVTTLTQQLDGNKDTGLEAAMVVASPRTGEVQAIVGGRDAGVGGFNRALNANRPIGSLVKPAVYLAALMDRRYTLASILQDTPITLTEENGREWTPTNYDKKSHGDVPLYMALAKSYNQATARLGVAVGLPQVVDTLHKLGFSRNITPYPSLLLGAVEMSPLEVAGLYQTLASGGYPVPLRAIDAVLDANGEPLTQYSLAIEEPFSAAQIELINFSLEQVMREGTGRAAYNVLPKEMAVAGKTGTTDGLRDSWFAGYSADTLAVVWLGRDDNGKTRYTGSTGALPIWIDFMKRRPLEPLMGPISPDIAFSAVDPVTGFLQGHGCPGGVSIPFIKGTEPTRHPSCIVERKPAISIPSKSNSVHRPTIADWFKSLWN